MRTRWNQAWALVAALSASATASSPVSGADLPPPPPIYGEAPMPPQDLFEGWWLGGTLGGATVTFDAPATGTVDTSGILGGIVGGYSWQNGPFVIGVEGDLMAADIDGSRRFDGGANRINPSIDTMADLRLRAGVTVTPHVLLFGTFGGAWANADLPIAGPGGALRSADLFGWSVGGGAEVAFNPNWSARFDYQFTNFNSEKVTYPGSQIDFDPDASTYRGSLIYRF